MSAPTPAPAPAPVPADVGIVAALAVEVGFLTDRLTGVRKYSGPGHTVIEGEHGGKLVALIVGGMGRALARDATEILLAGHRPRVVLSAGFAGALDPTLVRNDVVLAIEVIDPDGHRIPVDSLLSGNLSPAEGRSPLRTGRLLTVDAVVRTAAEKAALRARFGADVVDMETSAVAAACASRGVRFVSVRVVSDDAGRDLPPEVVTMLTRSGGYRVGAALRAIWNRPSAVKDFWALHEAAQEAADRLAEVTLGLVSRWPG